ncbi:YybH family protein [Agromyces archimandritae]|uniref:DUF4440 domain-containing protein n=1 Tax=Agromyces archimandritae TaxID=2781962 RepID=A0A975FNT4_9MICO|nr:DUF4440 domain-containing protein [Agromyces archimandritae]QTX04426.1 DUF4440 domain-containing protein [Agromyces archimandritae]
MSEVARADRATRDAVLAVEAERRRALLAADLDALDALFDDALVHIHAPGVRHDKAMLLEHVATRQAYLDTERGELDIRVIGDVAIATGAIRNRLRNPDGTERTLTGVVTQVLRHGEDGRWRFVHFQMTPDGEQVWGALPSQQAAQGGADS